MRIVRGKTWLDFTFKAPRLGVSQVCIDWGFSWKFGRQRWGSGFVLGPVRVWLVRA